MMKTVVKVNLKSARPLWLLMFICLGLSIAHCEQSQTNKEDALGDKADKLVEDKMYDEQIPGLALAVIKDGKILKAQGYGFADLKLKTSVTTNTVFRIASVSKQFVATAIMMLVEEGKLNLDDPVSKYLDGTPSEWKQITIRHLLTHTSGIPDFLNENIWVHSWLYGFDRGVFEAVASRPLHFAPGDEFRYSNSNYQLLGMIICKITGETYGDFLRERIFEPLGMTRTTVSPANGTYPGLASGYKWNNGLHLGDDVAAPVKAYAGGGILSTISDMAKWDAALYSEKLLKQSSLEQMWTPARLNDGMKTRYGFGWGTSGRSDGGHLVISHEGNFSGFSSGIYRAVDDQLTVIILDNRLDSYDAAAELSQKIARLYVWKGPDYKPIADKEPEITAHLRDIMERAGLGRSQMADFTVAEWAEWKPWEKQAQLDRTAYGPALSLVLVERTEENGKRSYRYRVGYKFGTVLLHIVIDEQNKIALWTVEDVDLI
jgi:CubicO group peptidase (beta-lactamase class C family)